MSRKLILMVFMFLLCCSPALLAQENKVEVTPFLGYTFSEGVGTTDLDIGGSIYDRIDPTSGFSYGVSVGFFATENVELEFTWAQQDSTIQGKGRGVSSAEFADLTINNYHFNVVYNMGDEEEVLRPFIFGGLGATNYSPGNLLLDPPGGSTNQIDGDTRFSSNWGGGVKVFPGEHIGFRIAGTWTPTYIKSDPGGYWCGWYGCWLVGDAKYSHQFEFSGGVVVRF